MEEDVEERLFYISFAALCVLIWRNCLSGTSTEEHMATRAVT